MNMRRNIAIIILAIGCLLFVLHPSTLNAVFALIFLGLLPGTSVSIPFWIMLPATLCIAFVLVRWIMHQPMYIGSLETQEKTARTLARKNVAKKVAKHRATQRPIVASTKKHYRAV